MTTFVIDCLPLTAVASYNNCTNRPINCYFSTPTRPSSPTQSSFSRLWKSSNNNDDRSPKKKPRVSLVDCRLCVFSPLTVPLPLALPSPSALSPSSSSLQQLPQPAADTGTWFLLRQLATLMQGTLYGIVDIVDVCISSSPINPVTPLNDLDVTTRLVCLGIGGCPVVWTELFVHCHHDCSWKPIVESLHERSRS